MAKDKTAAAEQPRTVRLKANKIGWTGVRRVYPGDIFTLILKPGQKLPSWASLAPEANTEPTLEEEVAKDSGVTDDSVI